MRLYVSVVFMFSPSGSYLISAYPSAAFKYCSTFAYGFNSDEFIVSFAFPNSSVVF